MQFSSFQKVATVGTVAALVMLGASGCSRFGGGSGGDQKVVLALSTLNNPFFVEVRDGAKAEAKKKGVDLEVVDAQNDSAQQANQLQTASSGSAKAIIVNPVDSDAAGPSVKALNKADIPVVAVDRTVNGADVDSFIASDNVAGGKQAADDLAKAIGKKGDILVLEGQAGTSAARDRGKGFTEGIKQYPGIHVVGEQTANFDRATALDVTTNLLQAHPDIVGIFAQNDEMALGAIKALGSKAGSSVEVASFDGEDDGLAAIKDGTLSSTIAQQPAKLGSLAIDQALKAIDGKATKTVSVPVLSVTKSNVDTFSK
ncbi:MULTISPECIES: substrate-binding domain-containing protein [unclassified Curtobacterium]|uniref:substrate-binding domain-containing protein n=1 Tax=unclassified Curtobacterium TaxID=257496 RepID=UPI000DA7E026|nr:MULTISPECIES: substrate-binding domain-containing protein [unclassified Curtobacterium]PZE22963.1 D-ribose ABC transporter substrate-binding protein [Curtobacterium sp. MCBD17_028]PZE76258.1 D-ribose ABC transporter substrate-binding protein [Curtobacterium sp. MCBD17_019]PZF56925.1 D-ribose ABC transporter substrate-binding protein [Curtobacterium sp. MCBD17_013]PZF60094.1 D-ribose ABC transporter substrate-binding protein [Curtobacterium sp. MCBD17_034]PZM34779.1 D-ribose ABC transporter 